ncbi:peptidase C14, caspase domain-containing protein [Talaromyces proteolyticus]|uniref:Peptidase C14, caspase domain-containing protein n=1 Tax=Talaromyces proteolyticus TaxID=1131652 RepID=A0AAD4Q5V0_9EURO|nr:peptidase C14, caspase domain-containing protein [Talaromyces proteolyticus]KAH8704996.1 peptidase C14, caspase domain-containing protein [Talaromyces proteolyticus]
MPRKKAVIIGINYFGTDNQLKGCINDAFNVREYLIQERGFSPHPNDMVMLTDEPKNLGTPFYPTGANLMAAFGWLVSCNNAGDSLWLSYSGHGSQVRDPDGDRESGLDDTICPVDFKQNGQISSDTLHKALVSLVSPYCRLTILFDCCHSGSAVELPYVFRPEADGQVNMVNNVKQGMNLLMATSDLLRGGFSVDKMNDAKVLLGGAKSFFHNLHHPQTADESGLADENFVEDWRNEGKDVWMFSGCADSQTSADTSMAGAATGAMSWAFINTMKNNPRQSYIQVLQSTRTQLVQKYSQIPQLSVGGKYDLNQPVSF